MADAASHRELVKDYLDRYDETQGILPSELDAYGVDKREGTLH